MATKPSATFFSKKLASIFNSHQKRLVALSTSVSLVILLIFFGSLLWTQESSVSKLSKSLNVANNKIQTLQKELKEEKSKPNTEIIGGATALEVKEAVAEVCGPKKATPTKRRVIKSAQASKKATNKPPQVEESNSSKVISSTIPDGGCLYTSDGSAILKNGERVPKGVEMSRISNRDLLKKYPTALDSEEEHKKVCFLWSKGETVSLQKSGSYTNNDTHRK